MHIDLIENQKYNLKFTKLSMEIKDEFDLEFGLLIREIENYIYSSTYDKSVRIRISNWCKKISQIYSLVRLLIFVHNIFDNIKSLKALFLKYNDK